MAYKGNVCFMMIVCVQLVIVSHEGVNVVLGNAEHKLLSSIHMGLYLV